MSFRGREPVELSFGTSGLRGLVVDITDMEAYINARGFLSFCLSSRDCSPGDLCFVGLDLRPSTPRIAAAVWKAILDAGLNPLNVGQVPTPALMHHAVAKGAVSIMVTGSHIPFDRNGIKFNRCSGEVLKADEAAILAAVQVTRESVYAEDADASLFDDAGAFREGCAPTLGCVERACLQGYVRRYVDFFGEQALKGLSVVFYQHSAVGRDVLTTLFEQLGAKVQGMGRSDTFVPIDTEAIEDARLAELQALADAAEGKVDVIVSTDGDSDRPMLVGIDDNGRVQFVGGDVLGIVVADWLGATQVAVPISSNDAVDEQFANKGVVPCKTKIGSPHVVRAMMDAADATPDGVIVGWEANGGFLTGTSVHKNGKELTALPTRDAALPLFAALRACVERNLSVCALFATLPKRFSKAGLLDHFPRSASMALLALFDGGGEIHVDLTKRPMLKTAISAAFTAVDGFTTPTHVNYIDGVRIHFDNGDIAHIRPSGNAPQLRIYACANTQARANAIVDAALQETPKGILRTLEMSL